MSFGFGVGDFIAVGELCWKLYSQVYEVSRGAPEAIQNLKAELGDMHLTINKLVEDTKDPDSILVQSGPDRLNLACSVLEKTQETLKKLDDLSGKYELLQKPSSHLAKRHFWKRNYDKVKFAAESRTINDLRAKLVFHNGQISLLLQMVQSSSLERIENMQKNTEKALQDIKAAISGSTSTTPLFSGASGADQYRMTKKLLENAQVDNKPWTSISICDWLQTGKWWLLKAQSQLHSAAPQTPKYFQAWVDLIKSSWILTDIIASHPHRTFFASGTQEMDILDIAQAVKSQHEDLVKKSFPLPALHELESSSWQIWISMPSTTLVPNLGSGGPYSRQWSTSKGFTLFQKFAVLRTSSGVHECIVFLEVKNEKTPSLIAQSFGGQDLYHRSVYWGLMDPNHKGLGHIQGGNVILLDVYITLEFFTRDDFLTAILLEGGASLCVALAAKHQFDETLIYTMALFDTLTLAPLSFDEAVRVIKPRAEELINDNSNSKEHSKPLWDLTQIPTPQQLADFWKRERNSCWDRGYLYGRLILHFSTSLEQCCAIFGSFPGFMGDDVRAVLESALRVSDYTHVCINTNSWGERDDAMAIETSCLRKLLKHTSNNKVLTHEILNALSHLPASSNVSPLDLAECSLESDNWHGVWYLLTNDSNIGANGTLPSEIWNLEFALDFIDKHDAPLELLDERPSSLEVFKEAPYLTTFVVISNGLRNAAPRLSSRGLLDPNLPALVNGNGFDVLSGLHRSGIPHWPLCMAMNMRSNPEIIRSLCQAGAHIGDDDEVLFSDLNVYKALLSCPYSQAREVCIDTIALARRALNHPESPTNESMVPQAFIPKNAQRISLEGYWSISSHVYCARRDIDEANGERIWQFQVISILQETQTQRNLLAWLRANATITDAVE